MRKEKSPVLEFSRRVPAQSVPEGGKHWRFEATTDECSAVARRLDLAGIERLEASFELVREGLGLRASGFFEADVVQTCVVTLEPVKNRVHGDIAQRFMPGGEGAPVNQPEVEFDALAEDPPEALIRGAAELGELVVEHLALALDPYPRAPHADAPLPHEGEGDEGNPFDKLRDLKFSATES